MPQVPTVRPDGKAVQAWRHRRGLTTEALGTMIGRSGSTIRFIETRERLTGKVLINQIANALKVDVDELVKPDQDAEDEPDGAAA